MGWRSDLLQRLPARLSMPVRARFGFSREPEMAMLDRVVRPGDNCLDIGCHLGIYAYHLLRLVGPSGSVVGFEPQAVLADYLKKAFASDIAVGRFAVHRVALGERPGDAVLTLPLEAGKINRGRATLRQLSGNAEETAVPVITLDSAEVARPVSFIKCDVEGFELSVLRGGLDLLRRDTPTLLIEIEDQHAHDRANETFRLLTELGYVPLVYRPDDGAMGRLDMTAEAFMTAATSWARRYVYNYFFVPPIRADLLSATQSVPSRK